MDTVQVPSVWLIAHVVFFVALLGGLGRLVVDPRGEPKPMPMKARLSYAGVFLALLVGWFATLPFWPWTPDGAWGWCAILFGATHE